MYPVMSTQNFLFATGSRVGGGGGLEYLSPLQGFKLQILVFDDSGSELQFCIH